MTMLDYHDAFAEFAHVFSVEHASHGLVDDRPLVTIAIPTFRRPALLLKALQSALNQRFNRAVEILILDNDPAGEQWNAILSSLPARPNRAIRYVVNDQNIGMFGNWNRAIELARGEWVTILNDDDLLHPRFLQRMFRVIDRHPDIDGLVAQKLFYSLETRRVIRNGSILRDLAKYLIFRWRFNLENTAQVRLENFYFGNELHNGLTFLFTKSSGLKSGGYRSSEFPGADGFLYTRYCLEFNFRWLNEVLGYIGIGENESLNKSTMVSAVLQNIEYRKTLTQNHLPKHWISLDPQISANTIQGFRSRFDVDFTEDEMNMFEKAAGAEIPAPSYGEIRRFRIRNNGF